MIRWARIRKPIVLVSEDHGRIHGNNGFEFWTESRMSSKFRTFLVVDWRRTSANHKHAIRQHIASGGRVVNANSLRHWLLYMNADLHTVCNSYRDVHPKRFLRRPVKLRPSRPILHLRHGFEGIKTTRARGRSFRNCLVRYSVAARNEAVLNELKDRGTFNRAQLLPVPAVLRWRSLLEKHSTVNSPSKTITWFLTWRDGIDGRPEDFETYEFDLLGNIRSVLCKLDMAQTEPPNLNIVLHHYWPASARVALSTLKAQFPNQPIEIRTAEDEDIDEILLRSSAIVTDYSSVAFDAGFLGKPVRFHCPDIDVYRRRRDLYRPFVSEMAHRTHSVQALVAWLLDSSREQDPYISSAGFCDELRHDLEAGRPHQAIVAEVERMLQDRIIFVGYNFFGIGGTVYSTKSLAGALADRGHLVELLSLRDSSAKVSKNPRGTPIRALHPKPRSKASRIVRILNLIRPRHILPSERKASSLTTLALLRLANLITTREFRLIVSTRESLHRFIYDFAKSNGPRCAYWFHNSDLSLLENYPGIIDELTPVTLPTVVAPSDGHFCQLERHLSYRSYAQAETIPNLLAPEDILPRDEVQPVFYANYALLALTRFSPDRRIDLEQLVNFAMFLANRKSPYRIDVYGGGELLQEMQSRAQDESVNGHITFHGPTRKPIRKIRTSRCVIDFSQNHTFGMVYLESILNGTPVFARHNPGSRLLLEGSDYFFTTFDDLKTKIDQAPFIGLDRLLTLYDVALEAYGPDAVCDQFVRKLLAS